MGKESKNFMTFNTANSELVNELEELRKKNLYIILLVDIIAIVFLLILINLSLPSGLSIFLFVFCAGGIILVPISCFLTFRETLKTRYVPVIMENLPNIVWNNNTWNNGTKNITIETINRSMLFAHASSIDIDDCFTGQYNGVSFDIAEAQLSEVYMYNDDVDSCNVFKGVIILFPSNKEILAPTLIITKKDRNYNLSLKLPNRYFLWIFLLIVSAAFAIGGLEFEVAKTLAKLLIGLLAIFCIYNCWRSINEKKKIKPYFTKEDKLKLEDIRFAKRFNVYSKDEVEGRYLITPAFMERFNNLTTAFGTNKAKCSFFEDKVMFAISTNKNLFEVGNLFTSLKNPKNLQKFFDELNSILKMVEYFKLDEHTKI